MTTLCRSLLALSLLAVPALLTGAPLWADECGPGSAPPKAV